MIPSVPDDRQGLADDCEKLLERAMARHHNSGDALIEILHSAQQLYSYLSLPILKRIARTLKLPPSRVLGVATFYHLFRFTPSKAHSVTVCLGTACYVAGAMELMSKLRERRGAGSAKWTIEAARCVGSCGLAPIVICDGLSLSRATAAQLEARVSETHDGGHSHSDAPG
jgi:bidirectional [NiFe] hydrogenase diaphorase subunit